MDPPGPTIPPRGVTISSRPEESVLSGVWLDRVLREGAAWLDAQLAASGRGRRAASVDRVRTRRSRTRSSRPAWGGAPRCSPHTSGRTRRRPSACRATPRGRRQGNGAASEVPLQSWSKCQAWYAHTLVSNGVTDEQTGARPRRVTVPSQKPPLPSAAPCASIPPANRAVSGAARSPGLDGSDQTIEGHRCGDTSPSA